MTASKPKARLRLWFVGMAILLMLVAVVAGVASYFSGPRYQGQRLEDWVVQLKQGDQKNKALAREALSRFGTAALPDLVSVLQRQDPKWKLNLLTRFPKLYRFMRTTSAQDRAYAAAALGELGTQATNAIPALERLAPTIGPAYEPTIDAALMKIKGEPLSPLLAGLSNFDATNWNRLAQTAAEFGTNAQPALPALCKALTVTIRKGRLWAAAYAIGYIHTDPALCVPALIESAKAGGIDSLNNIWALGEFEGAARAAIPLLRQKLGDANAMVRQSALGSLKRIMPLKEQRSLLPILEASVNDPDPNLSAAAKHMLRELRQADVN